MGSQAFIARDYDVFAGLDVDKKSISVTFTDHQGLLKSMRMPYSVDHLVNHVRKHYGDKKVAFAYEAGPTGLVKAKLRKLPCSSVVRFKLDQLLDNLEFGEKQVLKVTREIRRFCQNDPELSQCIDYLKSLPGIGWIVASQMLAR